MHPMVGFIRRQLEQQANSIAAADMQRYMKTDQPFYGVKTPVRKRIYQQAKRQFPLCTNKEYEEVIQALWHGTFREEMYMALEVAQNTKPFHSGHSWSVYEEMIRTASHWDTLDWLAARIIGPLVLADRRLEATIMKWSDSKNFWVRRASLLVHLKHKNQTNRELLAATIGKLAHEEEFFIRKAIGWVLREYAYTDPGWVVDFVHAHEKSLSSLSKREALKHVGHQRRKG